MEPFFVLMVAVGIGVVLLSASGEAQKKQRLAHVARSLGLSFSPGGVFSAPVMQGGRRGVAVRVEYGTRSEGKTSKPYTRFVAAGVAPGLRFEGEGLGILKVLTGADYHTGDDWFDPVVLARGEAALLRALLDEDTREALRRGIVTHKIVVADEEVALERPAHHTDEDVVRSLLDEVADLARRLADPGLAGVANKLARNVQTDPVPLVRLACLAALESDHSGPAAAAVARDALTDDDARVALLAARILGDTARLGAASDEALRAYAPHDAEGAARLLTRMRDPARLIVLLEVPDPAVQIAALHGLARIGTPEHVLTILPLSKGIFGDEGVKAAARLAIESIQARVGTGAGGRVTLAEEAGGEVSLAAEPGRVSVVPPRVRG